MQAIVQSVVKATTSSLEDGGVVLREYKGLPARHYNLRALKRLNITMSKITDDSPQRYAILTRLFGRSRPITSTYDLTVGEVFAFLKLAHPVKPLVVDAQFLSYLMEIKNYAE